MSSESNDVVEDRLEQIQRRAENFRELLKNGEEVTIAFFDDEVRVEESFRSQFERKHPKLFGRMLSLEAQLEPGWVPYFGALAGAGAFLFGLQLAWWQPWLGENVCNLLNSWWLFLLLPATAVYLASLGCGQWRKFTYRRHRRGLLELIAGEELDRDIMLVMLREVGDLDNVVQELKLDPTPFPCQAPG